MPFEKGESGNPAGRPRGARNRATLLMQNLLADDAEAIGRKAIEMAIAGDLAAIRLCMDRLAPVRKDEPVAFEFAGRDRPRDRHCLRSARRATASRSAQLALPGSGSSHVFALRSKNEGPATDPAEPRSERIRA